MSVGIKILLLHTHTHTHTRLMRFSQQISSVNNPCKFSGMYMHIRPHKPPSFKEVVSNS